ncbi:MAG: LLM class flavin-dependent oxidoreductase, partial [Candidatus Bathyarchaeia archaeon]
PHPPVYVGALGSPKTLELTGELADGWIPFLNTPESYANRYGYLKAGIARAGRRLEDVDAVTLIFPALSEDPRSKEKARALGKAYLIAEQNTLRTLGFDISVPRQYSYQQTLVADDVLNSIIDAAKNIPDELVEKFLPTTVDECIEVVDAFIKAGARHIVFRDMDRGAFHAVEAIGKKVLPYFKEP